MDQIRILVLSLRRQNTMQLAGASLQRYQGSCHRNGIRSTRNLYSSFFLRLPNSSLRSQKYDLYRLDKGPSEKSSLNVDDATYALKKMNYIRRMENKAAELYRQRLINGFLHLYSGQVESSRIDLRIQNASQRDERTSCMFVRKL